RVIGYFETVTGTPEQIVHLYRYDSHADWIEKLHGLYAVPELAFYFTEARAMVDRQETDFFQPAPLGELCPLWHGETDWLPGTGRERWDLGEMPDLVVEETMEALRPGGLVAYWRAMEACGLEATAPLRRDTVATWWSMTGRLHVVASYRLFASLAERERCRREAADGAAMAAFDEALRPILRERTTTLLRPVRVPQMSPLFRLG
ncbi:MAG: NIPSNAP family protein, partial [Defluviicoccus sp.]|nr:NIPSNAP family protein [Defluviicoccus sp.]